MARETEDKIINERIDKEISDREQACMDLQNRMDCQNDDKARELEELRERMMKENGIIMRICGDSKVYPTGQSMDTLAFAFPSAKMAP